MSTDLQTAVGQALVLLRVVADDARCPLDIRDAAEDASTRLSAALDPMPASLPARVLQEIHHNERNQS